MHHLIDNRPVLIFLGILMGAAVTVNLIGSQSYLLANTEPVYLIITLAVSNMLFAVFVKYIAITRIKFALFCLICTVIFAGLLGLLLMPIWPVIAKALFWFGLSFFAKECFRWMIHELATRYLNPAAVQSIFAYLSMALEIGSLVVVLNLLCVFETPNPETVLKITIGIALILVASFYYFFSYRSNPVLMRPHKKGKKDKEAYSLAYSKMTHIFVAVMIALGMSDFLIEYMGNTVFQNELGDYHKISTVVTYVNLFASSALLLLSPIMAYILKVKRPSPLTLYTVYCGIMLAGVSLCFFRPELTSFIILQSLYLASYQGISSLSKKVIFSGFTHRERAHLQATSSITYFVIPNAIVAGIFSYPWGIAYEDKIILLLSIISCVILITIILLYVLHKYMSASLYDNIHSKDKEKAVAAAQLLSYLNPRDYVPQMTDILDHHPKKILQKVIVLGLGYKGGEQGIQRAIQEFNSEREEIQLAVLDTLKHSKSFTSIEFIINFLLRSKSKAAASVKFNATHILAAIYGKKAIPILLAGLNDTDQRTTANIIETLGEFKDKATLPRLLPYIYDTHPRIKANALIAIAHYQGYREFYHNEMNTMLESGHKDYTASALYAIGIIKDPYFINEIHHILQGKLGHVAMVRRCAAWALAQLKEDEGYHLFQDYFDIPFEKGKESPHLHFFSLLDPIIRYNILQFMFEHWHEEKHKHLLKNTLRHLKGSKYDFTNEIHFVHEVTS